MVAGTNESFANNPHCDLPIWYWWSWYAGEAAVMGSIWLLPMDGPREEVLELMRTGPLALWASTGSFEITHTSTNADGSITFGGRYRPE